MIKFITLNMTFGSLFMVQISDFAFLGDTFSRDVMDV